MIKWSDIKQQCNRNLSFFVAVPALIWQILFLYIPLTFMVSASFFKSWYAPREGFTFEHFFAVLNMLHVKVMLNSFTLALSVAVVCLLIGYPVAYFFAIRLHRWKNLFLFFLTLPFWTNFLVQAYAWFFILEKNGLINTTLLKLGVIKQPLHILYTPMAVMMVMVYCYLPFMILPLYGALEKFDRSLIEASLDLGASPAKTFFKITLPMTMSGIRNGLFLVFVPAFGEYAIPTILGGGKVAYVGSLISSYYLEARNPSFGAAFTVVSNIVVLVGGYLMYRLLVNPTERVAQER